jgi:hypothetical protein
MASINSIRNTLTDIGNNVSQLGRRMEDSESTVSQHSDNIQKLHHFAWWVEEEVEYFHKTLQMWAKHNKFEHIVQAAVRYADRLKSIYSAAIDGRLSPELTELNGLGTSLIKLKEQVEAKGYKMLINSQLELYQCETSFEASPDGLALLTKIPIRTDEEDLYVYQFQDWPLRMPDGSWWRIDPGHSDVLFVNSQRDRFRTMSKADLLGCSKIRDAYICAESNVRQKADDDNPDYTFCLLDLFKEDYIGIKRNCRLEQVPASSGMIQIDATNFLARQANAHSATITCPNKAPAAIPSGFLSGFRLEPGCTAESQSAIATSVKSDDADGFNTIAYTWRATEDPMTGWWEVIHQYESNFSLPAPPPMTRYQQRLITTTAKPHILDVSAHRISAWDVILAMIVGAIILIFTGMGIKRCRRRYRRKRAPKEEPNQIAMDLDQSEPVTLPELIRRQNRRNRRSDCEPILPTVIRNSRTQSSVEEDEGELTVVAIHPHPKRNAPRIPQLEYMPTAPGIPQLEYRQTAEQLLLEAESKSSAWKALALQRDHEIKNPTR